MAEPIGLASGLLTLAVFAFQSSVKLYETIQSFRSHQQRVHDLAEELTALSGVLNGLTETVKSVSGVDFSALEIPLRRCGAACRDFESEILKCSARSGSSRTSFREWARLRYMGEDVDGFRRLLAGYKMTVSIALTDANLRKSSATAESLEAYNDLLNTARADLEDHLESIDEKLERILGRNITGTEQGADDVKTMREERLSTEKCLQICAQLSEHIKQIQLTAKSSTGGADSAKSTTSLNIANEGLEECKKSLAHTAQRLKGYEKELFDRLKDKLKTANTEDRIDLIRLRDEWETALQSMEICSRAQDYLQDGASTIENYATGDAVQFMVSTSDKTIHGKNRGLGWRTRQVGGHMKDDTLQQIAQTLSNITIRDSESRESVSLRESQSASGAQLGDNIDAKFSQQYGKGFPLTSETNPNKNPSSVELAKESPSRLPTG